MAPSANRWKILAIEDCLINKKVFKFTKNTNIIKKIALVSLFYVLLNIV